MTFGREWVLLLLVLPTAWCVWQWGRTSRRAGLVLKALMAMAIILALAEPVISVWDTKMAVAVLGDTSESLSDEDLAKLNSFIAEAAGNRGRHWMTVMPFARQTRSLTAAETGSGWALQRTTGSDGRGTNLEEALLDAVAVMPSGLVPRVVLISDGRENRGSIVRAAWQARELNIPVDVYPLKGRPEPSLRLESVSFPALTFTGEKFPISVTISSPAAAPGEVTIAAEGNELGASSVALTRGRNQLTVQASLNTAGAFDITGVVRAGDLGEVRLAQAVTVRQPRVLYVSQDPAGTEYHLLRALRAGEFTVEQTDALPAGELSSYQIVVLNNWDLEGISPRMKSLLEKYVQQGGGLLVIGGENNVYVEDPDKKLDALERALPAVLAPPRSPEGTCVVLIVDKSSSMEGRKMELARLSAIGVVENLRPVDRVGVLIFDNSFQWAVPIRKAEDKRLMKRLVSGITADGGTQIAPALTEAYRRALPVKATFKHIVLLTDGISEEGDSIALAQEAAQQNVTISTVGLGQDVNKAYLEKVAMYAKGKAYFLTDPSGLAQILLRDVLEHTGQTTVEKAVTPLVEQEAEILAGVDFSTVLPLKGYVRYEAKPAADTILRFEPEDPLLVRWQYGLGRSAVFTSDAKSRWAEAWVGWPGFDVFWTNLARDLLPHTQVGEARITHDSANGDLVVNYRLAQHAREPEQPPELFVMGPEGYHQPVEIRRVATGAYEGRVAVGNRQGLFRVRPLEDSREFPETGFYLQEPELREYGSDESLLRHVAEFTGGRVSPPAPDLFDAEGRATASSMDLWPGLLLLALLLNLGELVVRKWRGIRGVFQRWR